MGLGITIVTDPKVCTGMPAKTPVLLVVETRFPIVNVVAVLMFPVFEPSAVGVPMSLKAWVPSTGAAWVPSTGAACTSFIGDRQIASAESPKRNT